MTYQSGVYPWLDNSAIVKDYNEATHWFIPNDFAVYGEYKFYIWAKDNYIDVPPATGGAAETCTPELTLHVCGIGTSILSKSTIPY